MLAFSKHKRDDSEGTGTPGVVSPEMMEILKYCNFKGSLFGKCLRARFEIGKDIAISEDLINDYIHMLDIGKSKSRIATDFRIGILFLTVGSDDKLRVIMRAIRDAHASLSTATSSSIDFMDPVAALDDEAASKLSNTIITRLSFSGNQQTQKALTFIKEIPTVHRCFLADFLEAMRECVGPDGANFVDAAFAAMAPKRPPSP